MISFDEFEIMAKEELALLPGYVQEDLPGGVLVDPSACLHPARVADDLYVLGTYSVGGYTGKEIVLYYGSFMATMGCADREQIRAKVRETIRHEFLHHMETRAGEKGLVEEDRESIRAYLQRHGAVPDSLTV